MGSAGVKIIHKMLFEKRNQWNSAVASKGVEVERN